MKTSRRTPTSRKNKIKQQQRSDRNARIIRLIIAIALALFLWVYINGSSTDLIAQDIQDIPIKITGTQQLTGRGLTLDGDKKYYVNIRLRGSEQNLRAVDTSAIKASVDLSDFTSAGTVTPEVVIQGLPNNIILDARRPENLTLTIESVSTKQRSVSVNTSGSPADNLAVLSATTSDKVTVVGPAQAMSQLKKLVATVNVDGITADTRAYTHVVAYDEDGKVLSSLHCRPDRVLTTVKVGATKKVKISVPSTTGSIANGYKLKSVRVSPKSVTIGGSSETLENISSLSTGTLNINGASASVTKRLSLDVPDGVTVLSTSKKITVTAEIEPNDTDSKSTLNSR